MLSFSLVKIVVLFELSLKMILVAEGIIIESREVTKQ